MNKGIFIRLRESKAFKCIMAFAGLSMLNSLFFPIIAKADGPIAPEFSSFEQVNATQMVDPFTGDFSYNIPLLTVPGPDGGYPINLIYNAGITPDQEASWVGLGWNLNVGAITRQMRGVPDDFDGTQQLTKDIHIRPNVTVEIGAGIGVDLGEIFGFNVEKNPAIGPPAPDEPSPLQSNIGVTLIYNNYKGLGIGYEVGSEVRLSNGLGINAGVTYDPNTGIQKSAVISNKTGGLGITDFQIEVSSNSRETGTRSNMKFLKTSYSTVRTDFNSEVQIPFDGVYNEFEGRFGIDNGGVFSEITLKGIYGRTKPEEESYTFGIFGYNNDEKSYSNLFTGLRDYSKGEESPMSKHMKMMAPPIHTFDIYSVNAQGLSLTFRPYRSDVPVLNPAYASSENTSNNVGLEFGAAGSVHWGANAAHRVINTSSGVWPSENSAMQDYLGGDFQEGVQSFYYKPIDDLAVESINSDARFNNSNIVTPYVTNDFDDDLKPFRPLPKIFGPVSVFTQSKNRRTNRDLCSTLIEYLKNSEANSIYNYKPGVDGFSGTPFHNDNEIGVYSVLSEDGSRYEFALPVYADKEDVTFAIQENSLYPAIVNYDNGDVSFDNQHGKDNFYQKTYIPDYATQYNLTAIYSPDYVDIDNNGPTENDLGNYVKFTYEKKAENFGVRYPYYGANYMPGDYSNSLDDKAGFTYINREQYYLSKIETKTHVAYFRISTRNDNKASIENNQDKNGAGLLQSYKLDRIDLYCKTGPQFDPATSIPIKSVHFDYNYSNPLCQNAPGSPNGKLTLEKVWFEYGGNTSGENSPYFFSYANNYDYNERYMDKWGSFKPEATVSNLDNPYVEQSSDQDYCINRNEYASAWNLNEIRLPSGGIIKVEYEMDDYAYVQDKPAMHMSEIMGVGNSGTTSIDQNATLSVQNNRMFFKLETQTVPQGITDIQAYYEGIIQDYFENEDYVYFNCYMNLNYNITNLGYNRDYVSGFAKIKNGDPEGKSVGCIYDNNSGEFVGFVDVENVRVEKDNAESFTHPITKASWQYLYNERPDLFYPDQGDAPFDLSMIQSLITMFQEHAKMITGFYKYMNLSNCAKSICFSTIHPSFIRIPDLDGCMYGGGHRVKKITLLDQWGTVSPEESEKSTEFIQTFSYKLPDGRSSGVASNEPLAGGDECALRELLYTYSGENVEEYNGFCVKAPVCNDFYPAPVVGYSRVRVSNGPPVVVNQSFNKSGAGYEVYEYYTAKDYPVKEEFEGISMTAPYEECIPVPFIGSKVYNIYSFSQGFQVITNNMHGKPKAQKTYKSGDNCNDLSTIPVSEKQYLYRTTGAGYSPRGSNCLNNNVPVLFANDDLRNMEIGVSRDFFMDRKEDRLESHLYGAQTNSTLLSVFIIPVVMPESNSMFSMTRKTTSIKVIHQTGILEKIVTIAEGRKSENKLLAYDAATGQPLWSSTNNEFERPIYSYSYPAHWYYSGMGLASSNYRFMLENATASNGVIGVGSNNINWFESGDVMLSGGNKFWVSDVNKTTNEITLRDEDNNLASGTIGNLTIIQSGHRNLLFEQCGKTEALNWFGAIDKALVDVYLELLNSVFDNSPHFLSQSTNNQYEYYTATLDCQESFVMSIDDGIPNAADYLNYKQNLNANTISFFIGTDNSAEKILNFIPDFIGTTVSASFDIPTEIGNPNNARILSIESNAVPGSLENQPCTLHVEVSGVEKIIVGRFTGETDNSVTRCDLERILHSEAFEYSDDEDRVYADAGTIGLTEAEIAENPFRYGSKGRWGLDNSYLYYANRQQSSEIEIEEDGIYNHYTPFDWVNGINSEWWKTSEVTRRSVDGIPLETKDRLGNYSSMMYGHMGFDRSILTGAASNCTYYEMAYDGFEDHGTAYNPNGRGHLRFMIGESSFPTLSSTTSHTGKYAAFLGANTTMTYLYNMVNHEDGYFAPKLSSIGEGKYLISAWVNMHGTQSNTVTINVSCDNNSIGSFVVSNTGSKVDGWKLVKGEFSMPLNLPNDFAISVSSGNAGVYIDDIRIHPFKSNMVTAVYDAKTLRIKAILDENNYPTYYSYDLKGNLVQVKKETERGKQTLKSSWQNIFKILEN